ATPRLLPGNSHRKRGERPWNAPSPGPGPRPDSRRCVAESGSKSTQPLDAASPLAILFGWMIPERSVSFGLGAGPVLEGALVIPAEARTGVVVAHPHPLYGGDMDSAVVVAAVQAGARANLATLRFNFRGVGG